jgi:hypothetical protein
MVEENTLPGLQSPLEDNEPVFVLRARDTLAPFMVALWGAMAAGDTSSALAIFADMNSDAGFKYKQEPRQPDKINSAADKADEMIKWRSDRHIETFGVYTVRR